MISTVLRRSASRRTQTLTSVSAALFHHLSHSAANVPPSQTRNPFGVKARDFHFQSEFRASMVSPAGTGTGTGTGKTLAFGIPVIDKFNAKHGRLEESTSSKIKGTRICIAIRSFDNPEKESWCLPPHSRYAAMPNTRTLYTVLRSPHVDKKSREQFEMRFKKRFLVIKAQSHELSKKLFWLKRYRILGAQYELQFHCKTRLDMAPVLGKEIKERDSF